jgi:hypothetical protein
MLPVAVLVLIGEILLPVPLIAAEEVVCTDAPAYDEPIPMPCADIVLALEWWNIRLPVLDTRAVAAIPPPWLSSRTASVKLLLSGLITPSYMLDGFQPAKSLSLVVMCGMMHNAQKQHTMHTTTPITVELLFIMFCLVYFDQIVLSLCLVISSLSPSALRRNLDYLNYLLGC